LARQFAIFGGKTGLMNRPHAKLLARGILPAESRTRGFKAETFEVVTAKQHPQPNT